MKSVVSLLTILISTSSSPKAVGLVVEFRELISVRSNNVFNEFLTIMINDSYCQALISVLEKFSTEMKLGDTKTAVRKVGIQV